MLIVFEAIFNYKMTKIIVAIATDKTRIDTSIVTIKILKIY